MQGKTLYFLLALFTLSGFSGLVYESIWSHYLKLFLGHTAYAQTLVLAIFMGGMALGAWLAGRYSQRVRDLILAYAVVEGLIGLLGVIFHPVFHQSTEFAHLRAIPAIGDPFALELFKWGLSTLLIFPQSVLLGATFPLLSAGIVRRDPRHSGRHLAVLYFTNSLGAATGVLFSGFLLIAWVGLPGTILTAGLLNIGVALGAWALVRRPGFDKDPGPQPEADRLALPARQPGTLLLIAAGITGAASFLYEIAWVRMLNLVLGSTTHAFELMLSAFILGLALGSLWVRRRIDQLTSPLGFLGVVQVLMGILALSTLPLYGQTFEFMSAAMTALTRTELGYLGFNLTSHGIALLIMLPTTVLAGMTLPLITHALLRRGSGERSIGVVYACNTLGAIVGIFAAVHLTIPHWGLKGTVIAGAALDIGLGLALLARIEAHSGRRGLAATAATAGAILLASLYWVDLDPRRMASGVYRYALARIPESSAVVFHRDGKTATVSLVQAPHGPLVVNTNGKPDASVNMGENSAATLDEAVMVLSGALPLAVRPEARRAAVVGLGSGLSTQSLLLWPGIQEVDTIEIEPRMVDAAQHFRPRVDGVFTDPRSRIHIDDARTFFSASRSTYDLIVSVPSNPWVSGVASLFSSEFYELVRRHLAPSGLFAQWLQVYEIDPLLVASVLKALGTHFQDYALYALDDGNLLIVAGEGELRAKHAHRLYQGAALAEELRHVGIAAPEDLSALYIGDRSLLGPLMDSYDIRANSDYFPVLDLEAPRARFLRLDARGLPGLLTRRLPVAQMLGDEAVRSASSERLNASVTTGARQAQALRRVLTEGVADGAPSLPVTLYNHALLTAAWIGGCPSRKAEHVWLANLFEVSSRMLPYLSREDLREVWARLESANCLNGLNAHHRAWLTLFRAVSERDAAAMSSLAEDLLDLGKDEGSMERYRYLVSSALLGHLARGDRAAARAAWRRHGAKLLSAGEPDVELRLLLAHVYREPALLTASAGTAP